MGKKSPGVPDKEFLDLIKLNKSLSPSAFNVTERKLLKFRDVDELGTRPQEMNMYARSYRDDIEDISREKNEYLRTRPIQETSLERIERKLDDLRKEVATKEDIISQTNLLLDDHKQMVANLEKKVKILRSMQKANLPHKKLAKYSFSAFTFFTISFLANSIFSVKIVTPFWNNMGLLFSFGFLIMAWAMGLDWKEKTGMDQGEKWN